MRDGRDKAGSPKPKPKDRLTLYKEYRLIERKETEISGSWKGTHLLFFFLAFVFGSFCTFCFHVLMYLFDEKCVLFPKLLLLKELRHSVLYDYIPNAGLIETLPVDFVTTHWMDKSTCYLPTYVPLISGIFGLVWTTMFLMFSSGSKTLGLQRSWRLLPYVIVFSVAMSCLCIYTSAVTTSGLLDLCAKLSEVTGSATCSYTINVVTLAFERRIRGVFQAIQLTIVSAWLHTCCWVLTAVVALVRVLFVIDFRLVCISANLCGNIEKMLERHEKHIRTVSPEQGTKDNYTNTRMHAHNSCDSIKVRFTNKEFTHGSEQILHYMFSNAPESVSASRVPEEKEKLLTSELLSQHSKECSFIKKNLYDALYSALRSSSDDDDEDNDNIEPLDVTEEESNEGKKTVVRQYGNPRLQQAPPADSTPDDSLSIIQSKDSCQKNIEWKEVFSRRHHIHGADWIKSKSKDSSKRKYENTQKKTERIVLNAKSDETMLSTITLKPKSRNLIASETEIQQKVPIAQSEVASNRRASFESLSARFRFATGSKESVASTSQEMQSAALATNDKTIPQTTSFSKLKRSPRPSRVSHSQDQQSGDLTNDDDGSYHPPLSTKDEGTQTRKKEKQD
ncbi:uncharacterized protein LOC113226638 [Hyposmocoma kahamanoa]|uniref:uncharacterized protein LOC113226638 n=1 Tax=Hyposmocoma kahamanoa TaxID=1477025 RepID=UPI000E6D600B|nr:uncharacterized protein LOC113226638 [Hyposmocoma kahamanoa]